MAQHRLVQIRQAGARFGPELVCEHSAGAPQTRHRRRLPTRAVLRERQQFPSAFDQRRLLDDCQEADCSVVVLSEIRQHFEPIEDHCVTLGVQTGRRDLREIPVDDVGVCGTSPQGERVVEPDECGTPVELVGCRPGGRHDIVEPSAVDGHRVSRDRVPHTVAHKDTRLCPAVCGLQHAAERRDVTVQRGDGRFRRGAAPQVVDEGRLRDSLPRRCDQPAQQCAGQRTAGGYDLTVHPHAKRSEHIDVNLHAYQDNSRDLVDPPVHCDSWRSRRSATRHRHG